MFQGLDGLDTSGIYDVNPIEKYIGFAQEKLQQIYDAVQKCLSTIQVRRVLYEGDIKKQKGLDAKKKKQAKGISVL